MTLPVRPGGRRPLSKAGRLAPVRRRLDDLFRVLVFRRAGNRCERCGKVNGSMMPRAGQAGRDPVAVLQVAHFKSRRIDSTRWDTDNAAALCKGCHFLWAHHEPDQFRDWWLSRIGQRGMDRLNLLWRTPRRPDFGAIGLYLSARIADQAGRER